MPVIGWIMPILTVRVDAWPNDTEGKPKALAAPVAPTTCNKRRRGWLTDVGLRLSSLMGNSLFNGVE